MIVHFTARLDMATNNIEMLRRIVKTIHSRGHSLSEDWIEPQYARAILPADQCPMPSWVVICRERQNIIANSDVVIAEVTGYSSFGVGHQVALAQALNKPILLLTKGSAPFGSYSDGLDQENLLRLTYTDESLEAIVADFIEMYEGSEALD